MTEPPDSLHGPPIGLILEIDTPTDSGAVKITVPLDAKVGETTFRVMAQLNVDDPQCYEMWVAVEATDPDVDKDWHRLDRDDTLLDALRGAQTRPKIAPAPDNPDPEMEGNA